MTFNNGFERGASDIDTDGISQNTETNEFHITDPETLEVLEARDQAIKLEIQSLEAKVADIVITLTSQENMNENLLNIFTRVLENALTKIKALRESPKTFH